MNLLLDILLDNIGLIVVVGGIVLTLLSKLRRAGGSLDSRPLGKPNPMMPPFGGPGMEERRFSDGVPADRSAPAPARRPGPVTSAGPVSASGWSGSGEGESLERPFVPGSAKARYPSVRDAEFSRTAASSAAVYAGQRTEARTGIARDDASAGRGIPGAAARPETPLTADEAARGMMWAEILSAPRAKRPYGYRHPFRK